MPPLPVITGLGFITSIGNDRPAVLRSLRELRHGFETVEFFGNPDLPVKVAGTVKGFAFPTPNWRDWSWPDDFTVDRELLRGLAPHGVYALCALQKALADAGLDPAAVDRRRDRDSFAPRPARRSSWAISSTSCTPRAVSAEIRWVSSPRSPAL